MTWPFVCGGGVCIVFFFNWFHSDFGCFSDDVLKKTEVLRKKGLMFLISFCWLRVVANECLGSASLLKKSPAAFQPLAGLAA